MQNEQTFEVRLSIERHQADREMAGVADPLRQKCG
jgi:hypothetical protein